jgi:hypothetical protein
MGIEGWRFMYSPQRASNHNPFWIKFEKDVVMGEGGK